MTRRQSLLLMAHSVTLAAAPHMPLPRAGCIGGRIGRRILIAGGSWWQDDQKHYSNRADLFDPKENRWQSVSPLPDAIADAASATWNGRVYSFGGFHNGAAIERVLSFDGARWHESGRLPDPVMYAQAAVHRDQVFLFGGITRAVDLSTATNTLRVWDGKRWRDLPSLPAIPRVISAVTLHQGSIYVLGGCRQEADKSIVNLDEAWAYDIARGRWRDAGRLPLQRRAWCAVSTGDKIALLGGYTSDFANEIYRWNPQTGQSRLSGRLPHPLAYPSLVVSDRKGHVWTIGGETAMKVRAPWIEEVSP